jgi:hypothetical protein
MIYEIDPLRDPRWPEFTQHHRRASVFHTRGWLEAVRQTYGYHPVAPTTNGPGSDLENALAFCLVHSWLTGRRLVSLPFSDHCEPLAESNEDLTELFAGLHARATAGNCKYLEARWISPDGSEPNAGARREFLSPSLGSARWVGGSIREVPQELHPTKNPPGGIGTN